MKAWLVRLWTDPEYFRQTWRGLVGMVGMGVASGIITPPVLPDTTIGWYVTRVIGLALAGCAWWVKMGDKTPAAAKAMAHADPVLLKQMLESLGVPMGVASDAARKTEDATPPKV